MRLTRVQTLIISAVLLVGFALFAAPNAFAATYLICNKTSSGKITIRTTAKCAKGEKAITNVSALMGATGATGATGAAGTNGTNGSAKGYGFVSAAGNIDTTRSSSNVVARKIATGIYCLIAGGVARNSALPVAVADYRDNAGTYHIVQVDSENQGCNSAEWTIRTSRFNAGDFVTQDGAFSFMIP